MMKVVGEEGTSAEDYTIYQKGELLDAVYFQQNSFDDVDAACEPERQVHEYDILYDILTNKFNLDDKKDIRAFFNELRQKFLDWHGIVFNTDAYAAKEKEILDFYKAKALN